MHTNACVLGFLAPGGRQIPISSPRLSLLGGGGEGVPPVTCADAHWGSDTSEGEGERGE